ncbi:MAG: group II intron reverse transcriptase/maturase [bacterium]|nr:group II intron reverse transcriptase/maturase [bacterium]
MKIERVMERVYDRGRLHRSWLSVKSNAGAAGIDYVTVGAFAEQAEEHLDRIHEKLQAGTYRFKPVRRAEIPKPGSTKKRPLGIPVVMDRIVSQSLHTVLDELWEADFTASNFGFRRGKSQHQAIEHMRQAVEDGYTWCASIDLQGFFDEIPHDLILRLIRRKMRDERVVTLIARALKAGVQVDGKIEKTTKGCPQGSPVSPMLSNIVLNELDQELEGRGHRYVRWADDFVILLRSERAAGRGMESITYFLEETLGLPVNRDKSQVARVQDIAFLGFQIFRKKIRISPQAQKRFKDRVRQLTRRNNGQSMARNIHDLSEYLRGWVGYFGIQEFRTIFGKLDGFIRCRLRSMQLKKWKKPKKFQRMMILAGYPVEEAKRTWVKMDRWQSVARLPVRFVLNLKWFRRRGLLFLDDFTPQNLKLTFAR